MQRASRLSVPYLLYNLIAGHSKVKSKVDDKWTFNDILLLNKKLNKKIKNAKLTFSKSVKRM